MFVKLVILLLLSIVLASLLTGWRGRQAGGIAGPRLRPLMLRIALVLLVLTGLIAVVHLSS